MKLSHSVRGLAYVALFHLGIGCGTEAEFSGRNGQADALPNVEIPDETPTPDETPDPVVIPTPPPVDNPPPPVDNPPPPDATQVTDRFTGQEDVKYRTPDMYFVVDTSDSMNYERNKLSLAMQRFIDQFEKVGVTDFRMVFIGQNFSFPQQVKTDARMVEVSVPIESSDGLIRFVEVMRGMHDGAATYGDPNKPFPLKSSRDAELIMVTDDNAAVSAQAFRDQVTDLNMKLSVNGFVALRDIGSTTEFGAQCRFNRTGHVYIELAKDQNPAGLIQDVCTENWDGLMDNLVKSIIEKISQYTFKLTKPIDPSHTLVVTVDQAVIDPSLYQVNPGANTVTFKKGNAPNKGAVVEVSYWTKP